MHKSPGYAVLMLIFLLSLAGIPPTAGFLGKYYIFLALIQTRPLRAGRDRDAVRGGGDLLLLQRLCAACSSARRRRRRRWPPASGCGVALAVTGVLTLAIGIYPEPFLRLAQTSLLR